MENNEQKQDENVVLEEKQESKITFGKKVLLLLLSLITFFGLFFTLCGSFLFLFLMQDSSVIKSYIYIFLIMPIIILFWFYIINLIKSKYNRIIIGRTFFLLFIFLLLFCLSKAPNEFSFVYQDAILLILAPYIYIPISIYLIFKY